MNILIANACVIPTFKYGGTERIMWYLGKELVKMKHNVTYLVEKGSYCDFANVIYIDKTKTLEEQIPEKTDIVHFHSAPGTVVTKPYLVTMHGNCNDFREFDKNTVFVSNNHAARFGSDSFVHNGLDWVDYGKPNLNDTKIYFHFLGNASWRVKNVKGAINVILKTKKEKLAVLGGNRLNFNMGFRFTLSQRIGFYGVVDNEKKRRLLPASKGLIFPVRWHEPFGLAIIESLYFGCPVFGTPYGSLPEIIKEDVGFLSNRSTALTEAIENCNVFSRKDCHQYVLEAFNSRKMAESYVDKYYKVLNGEALNRIPPKLIEKQTANFLDWK